MELLRRRHGLLNQRCNSAVAWATLLRTLPWCFDGCDDVVVEEDVDDANEDEDVLLVTAVLEVVTDDESPSSAREIFLLDSGLGTISSRG